MTPSARARLQLVLRVSLAVAVLAASAWFVRRLDLHAVWSALARAELLPIAVAAVLNLGTVWWRSARLAVLLAPSGERIPTLRLFGYNLGASAATNLLPARAGELLRIYLLNRREGIKAASAVSAVVVEKIFDLASFLTVIGPVPLLLPHLPSSVSITVVVLAGGVLVGMVVVWLAARLGGGGHTLVGRIGEGAAVMRCPRALALSLLYSVLIWWTEVVMLVLCLRALHLDVPWAAALLVLLTLNLAIALPSTPGQVVVFEAGAVAALSLIGAPREPSVAFASLYHVLQAVPITLLGLPTMRLAAEVMRGAPAETAANPAKDATQ